jgi:integrase
MKKRITDKYLESLQRNRPKERVEIGDETTPGLVVRATPNGVISFAIRYRIKGGDQKRETIGLYAAPTSSSLISLAYARQRAKDIAAAAGRGIDLPAVEATEEKEKERIADRPSTVSGLCDCYIADYCKQNQRRWCETERLFAMHVTPAIGGKTLTELRRADIVEMLEDLQNKKGLRAQVNRVRSQVVAMLNWAVEKEWLNGNPAASIKKRKKLETPRSRVLSHDELRAIWKATENLNNPARDFIRMLILTGSRRDEIRKMEWREIDPKAQVWTLPAPRNKSGNWDRPLPLSTALIEALGGITRIGPYILSVSGSKPYSNQRHLKVIIDRESGVTGWVLHDIRRTVRTGLSEIHVGQETAHHILGHAKLGMDKVYNHHRYMVEMRDALNAWAKHVANIVSDERDAPNVTQFPGAATA